MEFKSGRGFCFARIPPVPGRPVSSSPGARLCFFLSSTVETFSDRPLFEKGDTMTQASNKQGDGVAQEGTPPQTIEPHALAVLERASIDTQISTAHAYPRSIQRFKDQALALATYDQETAAGCIFSLPRKDRSTGRNKAIEGPSVRLAEIVAGAWGNLRAQTRILGDDARFITAQAVAHDLETNVAITIEVRRRITTRDGRRYGDDMIAVTANAAAAIAFRNAVFKIVPHALTMTIYRAARDTAIGTAATLQDRRANMLEKFRKMSPHITPERILASLDLPSVDDLGLSHLATLIGVYNAIRDGEVSIDEAFPMPPEDDDGMSQAAKIAAGVKARREADAAKAGTTGDGKVAPKPGKTTDPTQGREQGGDGKPTGSA